MQDGQALAPKQLLSERIKNTTNILVTVSRDPSVDELTAALALTMMLNKLEKHATAVFSGKVPIAIEFLNPEKTFEGTVDSLRDFIIAIDKEKADRLRYKVEDDVVRIFITPYRTTITQKDLAFSQGDFNVELVIALGVEKREDLDTAITAHGRILHDSTVATINANQHRSELGAIDWTDPTAGSYCEMLMSLSESLKSGILDEQISTALLTGIVAATERFSNSSTTPKVMTMAAQLMAAGANQQLIATKLQQGGVVPSDDTATSDTSKKRAKESSRKSSKTDETESKRSSSSSEAKKAVGEIHVEHKKPSKVEQAVQKATELADDAEEQAEEKAEAQLDDNLTTSESRPATLSVEDLKKDIAAATKEVEQAAASPLKDSPLSPRPSGRKKLVDEPTDDEPSFSGTLDALTDKASDQTDSADRPSRNRKFLSHDESTLTTTPPINAKSPGYKGDEPPTIDPFAEPPKSDPDSSLHYEATDTHAPTLQPLSPASSTNEEENKGPSEAGTDDDATAVNLSELEAKARQEAANNPVTDARAAVNAALDSLPFNPANEPLVAFGAQPLSLPSLHDEPEPTAPKSDATFVPPAPAAPGSPALSLPPLPDFSTLPPLPAEPEASPSSPPLSPRSSAPNSNDPAQFKLPGQT